MQKAVQQFVNYIKYIDTEFTLYIKAFISSYNIPLNSEIFLLDNLSTFIKVSIYTLFLIVPISFVKIIYNTNKIILFVFLGVLFVLGVSLFATFLGFFQLAFI